MKTSSQVWVLALLASLAGAASAQSMGKDNAYYGELGYMPFSLSNNVEKVKPKLVRLTLGKSIHENLALEAMYADTVSKYHADGDDHSSTISGLALKPKMGLAYDTEVFARLGWYRTSHKTTGVNYSDKSAESSTGYGLGIQTAFTNDVYGQLDYMNYHKKNDVTGKGWTFSVGMRF